MQIKLLIPFFLTYCAGDVDGSIEAINDALQTYKSNKISLNVLAADVGAINENDIKLADTFKGKCMWWSCDGDYNMQEREKDSKLAVSSS